MSAGGTTSRWRSPLDEVTVTAPKMEMKGDDTVSYNVASFRAQEDLVIEDVLRKLPGITVRDNGQILYKAKPIAGLTIDGMDLLKGRYGIATRNISPDHIASVEILENHQAIKALKDLVPSDKTYINLKLKASSRGVFLLSAAAGGGYGDRGLWNAEAAPMYFGHSSPARPTTPATTSRTSWRTSPPAPAGSTRCSPPPSSST